jgi:hypothetical protein
MYGTIKARLEYITWFLKTTLYKQFLHSQKDLENVEARRLFKVLTGGPYKETLTNVVE